MQVFCFFVSQEGNAFAYASPNFQAALEQPLLDALKQVGILVHSGLLVPVWRPAMTKFVCKQVGMYVHRLLPCSVQCAG